MRIESPAFRDGGTVPMEHTCDGRDTSPSLEWSDLPAGTAALALIVDDPDAPRGLWTHWTVWNVPAARAGLPGAMGPGPIQGGGVQGANSWGNPRWQGPCPPGGTHRYRFRLFALDAPLPLEAGAGVRDLESAMEGHVLDEVRLTGRYSRSPRAGGP